MGMGTSDIIVKVTDPYERRARLYPALLSVAPLAVMFVCLYGQKLTAWSSVGSVLVGCGALYLFSSVARDAGKRIEAALFRDWGGKPTTQVLRHSNTLIDSITKQRYHAALSKGIKIPFPNAEDEGRNPVAADEIYQSAVRWLIEQTRDAKKFDLILKENIAYGFHRNMLGLKPAAVGIAMLALLLVLLDQGVVIGQTPFVNMHKITELSGLAILSLAVSCGLLVLWCVVFTKETVRRVAFAYAERLLQACEENFTAPRAKTAKAKA